MNNEPQIVDVSIVVPTLNEAENIDPLMTGIFDAVDGGLFCAEAVVVMDADLSHPASVLPDLIKPILSGEKDVVIGSRDMRGGGTVGWPLRRKLISRSASWLA